MDNRDEQRLRSLFDAACQYPAEDRPAYLAKACAGEPQLLEAVEALLECDRSQPDFLKAPILSKQGRQLIVTSALADSTTEVPEKVGRYHIVRRIAEGGMGTVYEAQQDHPNRIVALKVIRPGLASVNMLKRFEYEAHVLGLLQHPGIAQIYEAGTADSGAGPQPFFAMEFIKGKPITEYAVEGDLSSRRRLELLASVCDAVHHAHQKGVVHRDLKPGNILVDESGQPKILDFGVARATDADLRATTMMDTGMGQLVGTIPYMSPEQASGDSTQVDIRSDVYALGVLAFEMLTGKLPYVFGQKSVHEAVRVIQEQDPTTLGSIDRAFRGDIETLVTKALQKDKERRYSSASALAADIRRFLNDEPIVARPPSALYQISKFGKRHKAFASTVAVAVILLLLGTAGTGYGLMVAKRQEQEAQRQRLVAEEQQYMGQVADAPQEEMEPPPAEESSSREVDYIFEPSPEVLLERLIPEFMQYQLWRMLLESNASEQGARMVAMDNATTNAGELLKDLQLTYNRARQAAITTEIIEIASGAEALKAG